MSITQKIQRLLTIQKARYHKKGIINIIIAGLLLITIFWGAAQVGRVYWPQNIEDKPHFVFIYSFAIHTLFQIISFCLFLPGYLGVKSPFYEFQINKKASKPWQRKNWPQVRAKTIYNLLLNQFMVYPLAVFLTTKTGIRVRFQDFPTGSQLFLQILFVYFVQDFFFYWGHRIFHQYPVLYKMHKVHHEYDSLYTLITEYFHPVDFVLANLLPSAIPFMILGGKAHCFTFFFWQAWKVLISTEGHSGYEFPWSPMRILPLVSGPSYHDHHHSHNVGNFAGSCYFWDLVLDTNGPYFDQFLKEK